MNTLKYVLLVLFPIFTKFSEGFDNFDTNSGHVT
jgi:hypothetical protein